MKASWNTLITCFHQERYDEFSTITYGYFFCGEGGGGGFEQKLSHMGANTTFGVHYDISFINLMC